MLAASTTSYSEHLRSKHYFNHLGTILATEPSEGSIGAPLDSYLEAQHPLHAGQ
jgi:hypothetical protein